MRLPIRRRRWQTEAQAITKAYKKDIHIEPCAGPAIVIGDFSGQNGLSRGAIYDLKILRQRHHDLEILDIAPLLKGRPIIGPRGAEYTMCYLFCQPDNLRHILGLFEIWQLKKAYRIGRWVWETPIFPTSWRFAIDIVHEIWTPSEFSAMSLRATALPVKVVPHYVEHVPSEDKTSSRAIFNLPLNAFVGVAIMDLQSCPERKNPWAHVEAWQKAFGTNPDAVLILKVRVGKRTRPVLKELEFFSNGASNIKIITQDLSESEIATLQSTADVFLSLHRAEGYGLTIHEGLLTGRSVVATHWSANAEFGPHFPNYRPVNYRLLPYSDWMNHYPGQKFGWADADTDHAAQILQELATTKTTLP